MFFLLFGPGACDCFCCLGGGRVFFCCLGGAGDGSSLTYRSAWLVFKRPNNKKDQTAKKKHGFHGLGARVQGKEGVGSGA